jgi:hypothetical protein
MDDATLVTVVGGCLSTDATTRKAAEAALQQARPPPPRRRRRRRSAAAAALASPARLSTPLPLSPQYQHAPGQVVGLLRLALEPAADAALRQTAAIAFKNAARRGWEGREGAPSPLADADKVAARPLLLEGLARAPPPVRAQLEDAVRAVAYVDFPDRWPGLLPALASALGSGDAGAAAGALRVLRVLARQFEFRDGEDRAPLDAAVAAAFGPLLALLQALLANPSPSPDLAEMIKLCLKCYWSATYMEVPAALAGGAAFEGWMAAIHGALERPPPAEGSPADAEARAEWPWWKAKKWALHLALRLATRHGGGGGGRRAGGGAGSPTAAFAARWRAECRTPFLEAVLRQLAAAAGGAWVSPRCAHLLLQYVAEAVPHREPWKLLKPHAQTLLAAAALPALAFGPADAELWEEDPAEFVRKGYDVLEDMHSPRAAALNVLRALCTVRARSQLDATMGQLLAALAEHSAAAAAPGGAPPALAARMDGALLALGSLADVIKATPRYAAALEPLLAAHVAPLFASPAGHLRAKAAWCAGAFADAPLGAPARAALLQRTLAALDDAELPVRVDAAVAMRAFLEALPEGDGAGGVDPLGPLRPAAPALLRRLLAISAEADTEDLTYALESLVERFGPEIAPYAAPVMAALAAQFWRLAGEAPGAPPRIGAGAGGLNGALTAAGDGDDDGAPGALGGYPVLAAMQTVLQAVAGLPEVFPALEEVLWPILDRFASEAGADVFEEVCALLTWLTFHAPAISPRLWSLFPRVLAALDAWAGGYFEDAVPPLDNYVSRGTEVLLAPAPGGGGARPLDALNATLGRALARPADEVAESDAACAPRLMGVVLQHARGRVDDVVAPYLALIARRLAAGCEERELEDALLLAGADALYYDAGLALRALAADGQLAAFMGRLAAAVAARRRGSGGAGAPPRMRHFVRPREKKQVALGLAAALAAPAAALPPGVEASLPAVAAALVALLAALRQQEADAADARAADGGAGGSSDEEEEDAGSAGADSDEGGSDDDDDLAALDAARRARALRAAARQLGLSRGGAGAGAGAGGSDDDDDDEDEGWWDSDDSEDEEVESPIDAVSPYAALAEALAALEAREPARAAAVAAALDAAGARPALAALLAHAGEERARVAAAGAP